jgi:hypothetical protein
MTPILGILASQISGHLSTNSYESIATVTVGSGGTASAVFSSIPSTYKHLQIRGIAQTAVNTFIEDARIQFNSDTGSNYIRHALMGNGASATAYSNTGTSILVDAAVSGTVSGTANIFAVSIIDILDYTNTNKNKTVRVLNGADFNGNPFGGNGGRVTLTSGLWTSTAAITSITLGGNSSNLNQYSQFALYGVKG